MGKGGVQLGSWNPNLYKANLRDYSVGLRVQLPSSAVNLKGISLLQSWGFNIIMCSIPQPKARNVDDDREKWSLCLMTPARKRTAKEKLKSPWTESFKKAIERPMVKQVVEARCLRFQTITLWHW